MGRRRVQTRWDGEGGGGRRAGVLLDERGNVGEERRDQRFRSGKARRCCCLAQGGLARAEPWARAGFWVANGCRGRQPCLDGGGREGGGRGAGKEERRGGPDHGAMPWPRWWIFHQFYASFPGLCGISFSSSSPSWWKPRRNIRKWLACLWAYLISRP